MLNDEQQLKRILDNTQKLIGFAEAGDWDTVVELEKSRDALIKELFSHTPEIDQKILAAGLQVILKKNKLLTQFSVSQRDSLQLEISKAGHAHKAIHSYLAASS